MSEANATPAADATASVDTSITGAETAAASSEQSGGATQSSEAGQGDVSTDTGQGAGNDSVASGDASAEGADSVGGEGGDSAAGAPEQYAAFSLPDGLELSGEMLDSVTSYAKAHKLTQEQAQGIVDLGAKQAQQIVEHFTQEAITNPVVLSKHWANEWSKQTAADSEIGGANLKPTVALATRVFQTFASPALGDFLNKTGLAHHPELVRFMAKVGAAVSEDTLVTPAGGTSTGPKGGDRDARAASKLYPGMA